LYTFKYIEGGNGPTVCLIHGFGETKEIWQPLLPYLLNDFTIVAPDLPGFGESEVMNNQPGLLEIATALHQWLAAKGVTKIRLVGHSLGGYLALAIKEHYPDFVEKIVLLNSSFFADSTERKANRTKSLEFMKQYGVEKYFTLMIPNLFAPATRNEHAHHSRLIIERVKDTKPEVVQDYTRAMMNRKDQTELIKKNTDQFFLISGATDPVIPREQINLMNEFLKRDQSVILDNTGHMSMFEATRECAKHMGAFL
jgi:pimeloyl-ACP methyl ester carboxylesterase